jgi:hypothetical protein
MQSNQSLTRMIWRQPLCWLLLLALLSSGCRPAGRYPPRAPAKTDQDDKEKSPSARPEWAWIPPEPVYDVPILFVADTDREWAKLPTFWNYYPSNWPGAIVSPLGLDPLGARITFLLARQQEKVLIKVPRGLPDPTPLIPRANPPTLAKWQLGKRLFFDKILQFAAHEHVLRHLSRSEDGLCPGSGG